MHTMPTSPKLSVISITYNQEDYIREALESMVGQKVDFPFEIIIADDASSDNTQAIIKEFAEKYPQIIKPILRQKNRGSWANFTDAIRKARGSYVALCEGDDYWTDVTKLQRQVDYLDKHQDYALCFHPVKVVYEDSGHPTHIYPKVIKKSDFTVSELLNQNYIQTNSVVYRRQDYKKLAKEVMPGDWYLHLYHAQFGKVGFINRTMSVYRRHKGGMWEGAIEKRESFWLKYGSTHIKTYEEILKMYGGNPIYTEIIYNAFARVVDLFIELDKKNKPEVLRSAIEQFPDMLIASFISQRQSQQGTITSLNKDNEYLHRMLELKENHVQNLEEQLSIIHNSKLWKLKQSVNGRRNKP